MTDEFARRLRGGALRGLGSGFLWSAIAAVAGAIWGGHWGFERAEKEWGGFQANADISASVFVHGFIGVVVATCAMAILLVAWSLLTTLYASPLLGIIVWAASGLLWWKGLALGHWVATEVSIYEADPMALLALGSIWSFGLLVPTFLMNALCVWVLVGRAEE